MAFAIGVIAAGLGLLLVEYGLQKTTPITHTIASLLFGFCVGIMGLVLIIIEVFGWFNP